MFEVRITAEAKPIIERAIANHEGQKAGLMVHRQGPVGDVSRTTDGDVQWQIERHTLGPFKSGHMPAFRTTMKTSCS
jgi:hypothetical protein